MKKYLLNCFLLLIPIFIWNMLFYNKLPNAFSAEVFWKDIPPLIKKGENIFRMIVFVMPAFMVLSVRSKAEKRGLRVYLIGLVLYFLSWLMLIFLPESFCSTSLLGFTAPAYTTMVWFIGIALIGNKIFFRKLKITKLYVVLSTLFVIYHTWHVVIVFNLNL